MIEYNKKIIKGSEVRGENLRLPRALSVYRAALRHSYVDVVKCLRRSDESEVLIMNFHTLEIPDYPAFDIKSSEQVVIVCSCEDSDHPEVYALRHDFPIGLPHSNAKPFQRPISMCISEIAFEDVRLNFNSLQFLESIRRWFNLNSINALHEKDRGLEVFFQIQNACCIIGSRDNKNFGIYSKVSDNASTLDFTSEKSKATHVLVDIVAEPSVYANFACLPSCIGDLSEVTNVEGNSISKCILDLMDYYRTFLLDLPIIVIFRIKQKDNNRKNRTDLFAFEIPVKACDIFTRLKKNSFKNFINWFEQIAIQVQICQLPPIRTFNRIINKTEQNLSKITLIGVGTLGSNILDHFVRQGLADEIAISDHDIFMSHNVARHVLLPKDVMKKKVHALASHYTGMLEQKITAIPSNALHLTCYENEKLFKKTQLIIDASTSPTVERMLAIEQLPSNNRRCTVFLNPKGTDLVMFMEDEYRNNRLDLLEMLYQRELILSPALSKHMEDPTKEPTNAFNCRSVSAILDYDNIGILSSVASQQIKSSYGKSEAVASLWMINQADSSVSRYVIPVTSWDEYKVDNIKLYVLNAALNDIKAAYSKSSGDETGGCLFGCYDRDRQIVYVIYAADAPEDSIKTPDSFIRGSKGMIDLKNKIQKLSAYQVGYIGEWHIHPKMVNSPSLDDRKQFEVMSKVCIFDDIPFVQCIYGNNGLYINATM